MRKIIAWPISWILYWLGDWVSNCMHTKYTAWLYPIYNNLMYWSISAQEWGELSGPWTFPPEENR